MTDQKQTASDQPVLPNIETLRFDSYESLYESITVDGSLGILALGAVGVMAWRRKRMEAGMAAADSRHQKRKEIR